MLHDAKRCLGPPLSAAGLPPMPLQPHSPAPGQTPHHAFAAGSSTPQSHASVIGTLNESGRTPRYRPERNIQDIVRMKADRRAEIERRCQSLVPPIQPATLVHMDAFNAAIQIPMPLNDNAWDVLKDRLLAQRSQAEIQQQQHEVVTATVNSEQQEQQKVADQQRQVQQTADRVWTEIQRPLREKIQEYAESLIASAWADGRSVNKVTSGSFAADVLQHAR